MKLLFFYGTRALFPNGKSSLYSLETRHPLFSFKLNDIYWKLAHEVCLLCSGLIGVNDVPTLSCLFKVLRRAIKSNHGYLSKNLCECTLPSSRCVWVIVWNQQMISRLVIFNLPSDQEKRNILHILFLIGI